MDRNSPVPLWAVLGLGSALLIGIYSFGQRTITAPEASIVVTRPSPPPSTASTVLPVRYANQYYGYSFEIPPSWRLATDYMRELDATVPLQDLSPEMADFVVVTSASKQEENSYVTSTTTTDAIGRYQFAPGRTVYVVPDVLTFHSLQSLFQRSVDLYLAGAVKTRTTLNRVQLRSGVNALIVHTVPDGEKEGLTTLHLPCRSNRVARSAAGDTPMDSLAIHMIGAESEQILTGIANTVRCGQR